MMQDTQTPVATWRTVEHKLIHPVAGTDGNISSVVLKEPDIEALEKIDDLGIIEGKPMKVAQIRGIIGAVSGLPYEALKRIHRDDFAALGELAVPLLAAPGMDKGKD